MVKIAFLGMGAMGSRMVRKLKEGGHEVIIWNRTKDKLASLEEAGFRAASSPRQAAEGADVVVSMVRDDEAAEWVWLNERFGALEAMGEEAVAIECSTLSVLKVKALAAEFTNAGRAFLDAPLAGSRPQAEVGQLIFFAGGPAEVLAKVRPILALMGGAVHHAGGHGAGAAVKLVVNGLFGAQLAAVAELIGFATRAGVDVAKAIEIVRSTPVCSAAAGAAAEAMLKRQFAPAFPIDLVAKDFELVHRSARASGAATPICQAAGEVYKSAVEGGYGEDNITGVVQMYTA